MEQERKDTNQQKQFNDNMVDKVGDTNIHPVSDMDEAEDNAEVIPPGKLGDSDKDDSNN